MTGLPGHTHNLRCIPPWDPNVVRRMRKILLAVGLVSGCASYPVDPAMISVSVQPTSFPCGQNDRKIPVILHIENRSRGAFEISVRDKVGPPFQVSWLDFDVLNGSDGDGIDYDHGPGGHCLVPSNTLKVGPGDATTISAAVYEISQKDYATMFRIRIKDSDGHTYTTMPFSPCIQSSLTQ